MPFYLPPVPVRGLLQLIFVLLSRPLSRTVVVEGVTQAVVRGTAPTIRHWPRKAVPTRRIQAFYKPGGNAHRVSASTTAVPASVIRVSQQPNPAVTSSFAKVAQRWRIRTRFIVLLTLVQLGFWVMFTDLSDIWDDDDSLREEGLPVSSRWSLRPPRKWPRAEVAWDTALSVGRDRSSVVDVLGVVQDRGQWNPIEDRWLNLKQVLLLEGTPPLERIDEECGRKEAGMVQQDYGDLAERIISAWDRVLSSPSNKVGGLQN